jgi:membrane-bound lytic murein transglycosylase D
VNLAYLPLVESSFNVRARSIVGAVGMWQFMPETGKKFMRIDEKVDERRDPFASTRAAARLLKENYRLLSNWPLAITAYNHAPTGFFAPSKPLNLTISWT